MNCMLQSLLFEIRYILFIRIYLYSLNEMYVSSTVDLNFVMIIKSSIITINFK